jgi:hypothetical protein
MKYFVFALLIVAAVAAPAEVVPELKQFRADLALPEAWDFA